MRFGTHNLSWCFRSSNDERTNNFCFETFDIKKAWEGTQGIEYEDMVRIWMSNVYAISFKWLENVSWVDVHMEGETRKKIKILFQQTPCFNETQIYGRILCHYFICFSHFSFRRASIMVCLLFFLPHRYARMGAIEVCFVVNLPLKAPLPIPSNLHYWLAKVTQKK